MFFAAFVLLAVAACAVYFGPFGPTGKPDPTIIQTVPKPDYFFLWLYALLSLLPPSLETPALLIGPVVVIVALLLLPFLSGEGEKSWRRRPIAVVDRPADRGDAWDVHAPRRVRAVESTHERLERRSRAGAILQRHDSARAARRARVSGQAVPQLPCPCEGGGQRGPALDSVAVRLTQDQLIRQVIQGGGNMPAYGKNLSPAETTALVAFLVTLHPAGQGPARDASRDVVDAEESGSNRTSPNRADRCHRSMTSRGNPGSCRRWVVDARRRGLGTLYIRGFLRSRSTSPKTIPASRAD